AMQNTMSNITAAFNNLAPAAAPVAQAFTDIMSVGSDLLPELAHDVSEAATAFADFISQAAVSGDLRQFMQDGIDAVKALGQALWEIGGVIYRIFGADGAQNVEEFTDTLSGITTILAMVGGDFRPFAADIREELDSLTGPAAAFRDALLDIPEAAHVA